MTTNTANTAKDKGKKALDNELTNALSPGVIEGLVDLIFSGFILESKVTLTGKEWAEKRRDFNSKRGGELKGSVDYWVYGAEYTTETSEQRKKGGKIEHNAPGQLVKPTGAVPICRAYQREIYIHPKFPCLPDGKPRLSLSAQLLFMLGVEELDIPVKLGGHVLIHCVVWRFYANAPVPNGLQISHIGDAPKVLTPQRLVAEPGAYNRSRTLCNQGYLLGEISNARCLACGGEISKDPHCPPCTCPDPRELDSSFFQDEAPGVPYRQGIRNQYFTFAGGVAVPDFPKCFQCRRPNPEVGGWLRGSLTTVVVPLPM